MTKKEIRSLSDKELDFRIEGIKNTVGTEQGEKFIESRFFWNGLYKLVVLLIQLFRERKRRKNNK